MTDKQFVEQLNKLSGIQPNKEWVALTKQNILGVKVKSVRTFTFINFTNFIKSFSLQTKLAYSFAALLIIFAGFMGVGRLQLALAPIEDESSKYNFELANKKLEELAAEVMNNSTQNKVAVVNEFKASLADAAKNLIVSAKKNPKAVNDIIAEAKKIKENAVLLDKIGESGSNDLYKSIVQEEIKALMVTSLTDAQKNNLEEIQKLFDDGKYSDAFEKILTINN